MAKIGGLSWIAPVGQMYFRDGQAYQDFRVRFWHPYVWWIVVKTAAETVWSRVR